MAYRSRQITTLALSAILLCGTVAGEHTGDTSEAISSALEQAGDNKAEIRSALARVAAKQSQGMEFLIANMPERDLKTLSTEFLLENTNLAYRALQEASWSDRVPTEIFLNNILPYANVNERRDAWRKDFHARFGPLVKNCKSPAEAGELLNRPLTPREQEVHVPVNLSDRQNAVDVRVWEKVELVFEAQRKYTNPYADVDVWVQLKGPNFDKKVYGFWGGGSTFKVRVLADEPGTWKWTSGSNQNDGGFKDKTGGFEAVARTETEIEENPNTRGLIRTNPQSPHSFMYADGKPFFFIADTWWAAMTWRYPFAGGKDIPASYVPDESNWCFEGGVQWLKRLGFNSVAFIASFPSGEDRAQKDWAARIRAL